MAQKDQEPKHPPTFNLTDKQVEAIEKQLRDKDPQRVGGIVQTHQQDTKGRKVKPHRPFDQPTDGQEDESTRTSDRLSGN